MDFKDYVFIRSLLEESVPASQVKYNGNREFRVLGLLPEDEDVLGILDAEQNVYTVLNPHGFPRGKLKSIYDEEFLHLGEPRFLAKLSPLFDKGLLIEEKFD